MQVDCGELGNGTEARRSCYQEVEDSVSKKCQAVEVLVSTTVLPPGCSSDQACARSAQARRACALRALGLLLADGTPSVGGGKTF